jgi:chaperonin GroEL (HSP60 family)
MLRAATGIFLGKERDPSKAAGRRALRRASEGPLRALAASIQADEGRCIEAARAAEEGTVGLNVETGLLEDLKAAGIVDSAVSVSAALEQGITQAKTLLLTDS